MAPNMLEFLQESFLSVKLGGLKNNNERSILETQMVVVVMDFTERLDHESKVLS